MPSLVLIVFFLEKWLWFFFGDNYWPTNLLCYMLLHPDVLVHATSRGGKVVFPYPGIPLYGNMLC